MTKNRVNDKYKKEHILGEVKNEWGYADFNGDIVLVKNCIKKNKFNKIYQIIISGDDAIDGLYIINSYDVNVINVDNRAVDAPKKKIIKITNKKFDKYAGCDGISPNNFQNEEKYFNYLKRNNLITDEEISMIKESLGNKSAIKQMQEFILDA